MIVLKYKIFIAILLLVLLMATSCQPTPENVIIRNKGNDTLANMLSKSEPDNQFSDFASINTVSEHIANDKLNVDITIDADVIIPNASELPVISYRSREFIQEDIEHIISVLCKDKKLYEINQTLTVDEINQIIIYYKKELSELTDENISPADNGATPLTTEQITNTIKEYERLRETAPTEIELIPASFTLPSENQVYLLEGQTDALPNERETITIFNAPGYGTQITYYNPSFLRHSYKEHTDIVPEGLTITEKEAIEQAQTLVNALGENQMHLCSIVADESVLDPDTTLDNERHMSPYYQLTFIRTINNIPSTYDYRYFAEDESAETLYYERIYVYVNDEGIIAFEWYSPLVEKEILNNNVGIIEFNEILQEAIKDFPLISSKDDTEKIDRTIINIDTIRLGYMQVKMKNRPDEYMFIPVWDFFGSSEHHYTEMIPGWSIDEDGWLRSDNLAKSYLTINAIDGSTIDRSLGY